jgi:hypothetical protein
MNRLFSGFSFFSFYPAATVRSRRLFAKTTLDMPVNRAHPVKGCACAMLCALAATLPSASAQAQVSPEFRTAPRSLITKTVDRGHMLAVSGAVRAEATSLPDLGEVKPSLVMEHIQIVLQRPVERQAAFDAQTEALHVRGSSSYHKWLTPAEVGSEFGPSSADLVTLTAYLESEGFTVNFVAASGMFVDFTGTAAQVERSFKTTIHSVQDAGGEVRFAAISPASLPEAIAPLVFGFVPLSNLPAVHPMLKKKVRSVQSTLASLKGISPELTVTVNSEYDVGPQDFYTIYNETPLLASSINGTGVTVAVIEETNLKAVTDVTTFRHTFNVIPNTPNLTVEHGAGAITCGNPGVTSKDEEGEAVLDTEWAGSIAPDANLIYMSCASTTTAGIFLSAEAIIQNNLADTMSLSYGEYEAGSNSEATLSRDLWEQAAAQGETVVVSAGDSGSDAADQNSAVAATHGINVSGFSSTNWNVSAGGTDFQDGYNYLETQSTTPSAYGYAKYWSATNGTGDGSALSYIPEIPWNETCASSQLSYFVTGNSTNPNAGCENASGQNFVAPGGGGGGPSNLTGNARATWQSGTVFGLPATSTYPNRLQPDISMFASSGFWGHGLDYYQSDVSAKYLQVAGGTSFVAPQLAGMFALIVQNTGERQGQPDYVLYGMAGKAYGTTSFTGTACSAGATSGYDTNDTTAPASTCVFNDIQVGNISQACTSNNCYIDSGQTYGILSTSTTASVPAFNANNGYDMATGLGSVNINNLVANWQNTSVGQSFTPLIIVTGATGYTYGAPVASTYTATVSGPGSFPTGSVTFSGAAPIGSFGSADVLVQSAGCNYKTIGTCTESTTQAYTPSATTVNAGAYIITATYSTTNENYTAGSGTTTLTIAKQTPTLTQAADTYGYGNSTVPVTATLKYTGAGLAPTGGVNFTVNGGAAVNGACTAAGLTLTCTANVPTTGLAAGTAYPVTASYPGDVNYAIVNAGNTTLTLTTTSSTITFTIASPQHTMVPLTLSSTSNSTGATTYSVASGPATISGGVATFTAGGTVMITANQAASASYAATAKTATFTVLAGSIWLGDATNAVTTFDLLGNAISSSSGYTGGGVNGVAKPLSEAFDASGNFWIASSAGVSEFNQYATAYSSTPTTSGGISSPKALAVDGQGYVWIANASGAVSALNNAGAAVSPSSGYTNTGTSTPGGIVVDLSGNVWLTNTSANTVTEILGVATPIAPPSTSLANGTTGVKP